MIPLAKPSNSAREVFCLCVSNYNNLELKCRLNSIINLIERASIDFEAAALNAITHQIPIQKKVGDVTKDEMVSVYTDKFAKQGQPGSQSS